MSCGRGWQHDGYIIAERGDGFQSHVAGALDGPFIVLFQENRSDQSGDGGLVGEDPDDLGAALDLAVEALDRVCAVDLDPMLIRSPRRRGRGGLLPRRRARKY
jgi:hypothetical protein